MIEPSIAELRAAKRWVESLSDADLAAEVRYAYSKGSGGDPTSVARARMVCSEAAVRVVRLAAVREALR